MTAPLANGTLNQRKVVAHTLTGLKRWSCHSRDLPSSNQVKALHVYDFDNTLFMSPLPNQKLWNLPTVAFLQTEDCFINGGWWHDQRILKATGNGIEREEPKAWQGWWNEHIVELVELSMKQEDALTVLLTGRGESNFADVIKRIVASKNLAFDMICLKPQAGPSNQRFRSTMQYKQAILEDLVLTYKDADQIRIYEDRPKQHVADQVTTLDPIVETSEVQRMINDHNSHLGVGRPLEIKRTVFYTGYLISASDTAKLLTLVKTPHNANDIDLKFLANNILITFGPAQASLLGKIGGMGYKQTWQVTGFGMWDNKVWAARVTAVPPISVFHTEASVPFVLLAHHRLARPAEASKIHNWQPVSADKQYIFQTTIGEKVQLRIEAVAEGETEFDSLFDRKNHKRRHSLSSGPPQNQRGGWVNDENRRQNGSHRGPSQNRGRGGGVGRGGSNSNNNSSSSSNRGGRSVGTARGGAGSSRTRGGGQKGGYKSLDDVGRHVAPRGEPNYDDYLPSGGGSETVFPPLNNASGGLPYGK